MCAAKQHVHGFPEGKATNVLSARSYPFKGRNFHWWGRRFSNGLWNVGNLQYISPLAKKNSVPDRRLAAAPLWTCKVRKDLIRYLSEQPFAQGPSLLHRPRLIPSCSYYVRQVSRRLHSNQRGNTCLVVRGFWTDWKTGSFDVAQGIQDKASISLCQSCSLKVVTGSGIDGTDVAADPV